MGFTHVNCECFSTMAELVDDQSYLFDDFVSYLKRSADSSVPLCLGTPGTTIRYTSLLFLFRVVSYAFT